MKTNLGISLLLAMVVGSTGLGDEPVSSAFTYQGRLSFDGIPVNDTADFEFTLYDAPSAGAVVGTPVAVDEVAVADGLLSVELDFGANVFDGNARWLETAVRSPAGAGLFTVLDPRQPLTAAPYALYALNGPGSAGLWELSGSSITNTNSGFVGVNRSTPVTGAEYFGIQAPVSSGYGGMYIQTDGADGWPFYGYRAGAESAWTYMNGTTGDWILYVDGPRLTVTDEGRIGIGTTAPDSKLTVVDNTSSSFALSVSQAASNATAIVASHTGSSGNAGNFGSSSTVNTDTALLAIHAGPGKAFLAYNYGTGTAAEITVDNPGSTAPALVVTNSGSGPAIQSAGLIESTSGGVKFPDGTVQMTAGGGGGGLALPYSGTTSSSSTAFSVTNDGAGRAAYFESTSDGEALKATSLTNDSAVTGINSGTGSAAFFQNFNGTANTVTVSSFADGKALNVLQLGDGGPAGHFEVNNAQSDEPAIRAVVTSGVGYAIEAQGAIKTDLLEITGGADLAEPFEVTGSTPQPGMVMVIDATQPGRLTLSTTAYDRKVAGIVSGAGGVRPGMVMAQQGSIADGAHQVALTGRVYCWCDATAGQIEPGDLLTTANRAGHAMKASEPARASGAVIGKAMTGLEEGTGLVLVLVSLQ